MDNINAVAEVIENADELVLTNESDGFRKAGEIAIGVLVVELGYRFIAKPAYDKIKTKIDEKKAKKKVEAVEDAIEETVKDVTEKVVEVVK